MDYYSVLRVPKDASYETIKKNYKFLATQYHPDKNKDGDAPRMFKRVSEAYKILSDPYERGRYDALMERRSSAPRDFFGFMGFPNFSLDISQMMKQFEDIAPRDSNGHFRSYSSSTVTRPDKDGKIVTSQRVTTNRDGDKDQYYRKYYIDPEGNKQIIKEDGNKKLLGGSRHYHRYRLIKD